MKLIKRLVCVLLVSLLVGLGLVGCNRGNIVKGKIAYGSELHNFKFWKNEQPNKKASPYHHYWQAEVSTNDGIVILKDTEPFGDMDYVGFKLPSRNDYIFSRSLKSFEGYGQRYKVFLNHDLGFYQKLYKKIINQTIKSSSF